MSNGISNKLTELKRHRGALRSIARGVEKEGLRVTANGLIAQTGHPRCLGSALTHPAITTDYSEALLELITPVHTDPDALLENLSELHTYVHMALPKDETVWAGSMPCGIRGEDSIRIAHYGDSNPGRLKHVYRVGLANRYGRIMQSIAGLHFNFSLGDEFWSAWNAHTAAGLQEVKTESYFALIRNFRRWSWLLMYLFGASPVLDESFLSGKPHRLQKLANNTFGLPYATSLRMSDLGYQNNAQASLKVCFNHLHTYINTLFEATHSPYPKYQHIGLIKDGSHQQLNTNLLQIENEYYNTIRPKRVTQPGEKPLQALANRGVEYIEVRCLDLNPFLANGIDSEQVKFLDAFLLTCLLDDSPLVNDAECLVVEQNFKRIVEMGRSPDCRLLEVDSETQQKQVRVADAGQRILDQITHVADALDKACHEKNSPDCGYVDAVAVMKQRVLRPEETLSARVLETVKTSGSYLEWLLAVSQQHKKMFLKKPLSREAMQMAVESSEQSWLKERELQEQDQRPFAQYLHDFLRD